MARPLHAQLSFPALRANVARARAYAPGAQMLAVVKANAYGHGLMRVLPALADADGLALVELDTAIALREAKYAEAHPAARGILRRGRAAGNRGATDRGCGAQRGAVADAGALATREADRGVHQDQHRDEPPGDRADERRGSGRAPQQLCLRRRAAADDAFRPRRRGLRHRRAARRLQCGLPRHAVSALARQFRGRRALRRNRRRDRSPRHHALRGIALSLPTPRNPSACGR